MPETYITLEDAAELEGISYTGMVSRVQRNPQAFRTKTRPRLSGGKDQVLLAVSSLTAKGRRAYKATKKVDAHETIIEKKTAEPPWYLDVDLNWYIESNRKKYYEAIELSKKIQQFIDYSETERTAFAERFALSIGVSQRTLYRYTEAMLEASAWALRLEAEDGTNRDYFKPLALCRKPKSTGTFPSLSEEQKAVIENIWFDKHFAANLGTVEMLYERFCQEAERRGWEEYPSVKTVGRYVRYLMDQKGAASARYLAANGTREWKNKMMVKAKRDATTLEVMEYVVGDEHTFDLWVQYTAPNGKVKAVRPKLVAWMDQRSRCIVGDVICVDANSQTLKESLVKMIYSDIGGVPKMLHIDNGKDYTGQAMTGQSRKERAIEFSFDAEAKGFYQSIGIQEVSRSLPYQPWDKPIERFFNTVCTFSKWFDSYVGTLTGSTTYAKRKKDVDGMLERGELLTMDEFFDAWTTWKEKYHNKPHRALKAAGEQWTTPLEVFQNAERYHKAAPPREYAAMLLMQSATARVTNQGINRFGTLYTHDELCHYVGQHVGIKWDIDDVTRLYVFDTAGRKICEATAAELLQFGDKVSQLALEEHKSRQNRHMRQMREVLDGYTTPFEERLPEGRRSAAVGKMDLTIKAQKPQKTIALPVDKEYRAAMAAKPKKTRSEGEFLRKKADDALSKLRAMNE